jgi:hypothetical protein
MILAIAYRDVTELKPYPRNARTHSRKQIKQIAAAIKEFGFTNPVLIDEHDQIIAGHGRVAAARLLDPLQVPTLQLSHLSPTQKRAYILADNRLAEKAGWDKEILAVELQGLLDDGFEVILTGFEVPDVDVVLDAAAEAKYDRHGDDLIPDPGSAVSRPGDLWRLGGHRLLCGSALDAGAYVTLLEGAKVALVITDPPYDVAINGHVGGKGQIQHRDFEMACGEMTQAGFTTFLTTTFERLAAQSTDGAIHYVFMDWRHMQENRTFGVKYRFHSYLPTTRAGGVKCPTTSRGEARRDESSELCHRWPAASRIWRPDTYQRLPLSTHNLSCKTQPVHTLGHSRHFDRAQLTSGILRLADLLSVRRQDSDKPVGAF